MCAATQECCSSEQGGVLKRTRCGCDWDWPRTAAINSLNTRNTTQAGRQEVCSAAHNKQMLEETLGLKKVDKK